MTEMLTFPDVASWERWLAEHSDSATEVWLRIARKGASFTTVTASEGIDGALCFGWIDSHRKGYDDSSFLQRYSPRRAKSAWSKINVDKVEALLAAGRMREPGLAAVRAAQADGRWDAAYPPQRETTTPPDLEQELAANPAARAYFDSLGRTGQYGVILHLLKAPNPQSRADRLHAAVTALEAGRKP